MIIFPHKEVNIFLAVPALDDNDSGERENWWICCLRGDLACHDVHQICQYVSVPVSVSPNIAMSPHSQSTKTEKEERRLSQSDIKPLPTWHKMSVVMSVVNTWDR